MSFFTPQTKKVDLGGGNWVLLRKLTAGGSANASGRAMTLQAGEDGNAQMIVNVAVLAWERVKESIAEWGGPGFADEGGSPVPFSHVKADELPEHIMLTLQQAVRDFGGGLSEEEKKPSGEPTKPTT